MKEHYFENEHVNIWVLDGWLLCVQYRWNLHLTLDVAMDLNKIRLDHSKGITRPMFTDARNIGKVDKEARDYLAKHGTENVSAGAFLIASTFEKIIGGIFIQINKPPIPTKLFTDEREAMNWLQQFKPKL